MREPMNPFDDDLGTALRGLPLQSPTCDVWSQLAAELTPRARRRAWPFVAIAAAVLIAIAATMMLPHPPATVAHVATSNNPSANTDGDTNTATTSGDMKTHDQLMALQMRSRELEQWLNQTSAAAAPLPGRDLAAASEIESLIGVVDVQLAASDQPDVERRDADGRDEEKLWRRRVDLLEDLTALRYSNYRLAENGAPATWIN